MHYGGMKTAIERRGLLKTMAALPAVGAMSACARAAESAPMVTAKSILDFLPSGQHEAIRRGASDFDCAGAIREAVQTFDGAALHFPPGKYLMGSSVQVRVKETAAGFGPGPWILGSGIERTIFVNRASDGPMFDFDSDVDHARRFVGSLGVRLEGFSITGTRSSAVATSGIRLRAAYQARLLQLRISHQGADGLSLKCTFGDNDASNMILLDQIRIEDCGGWGISAVADPGFNENSFVRMNQVFVQGCGSRSADSAPVSGGMAYKGQILHMDQCAFTLNENVAMFIKGEPGLAQTIELSGTTFENNHHRHLLCTGVSGFKARNIQFYSNDIGQATMACEFSADKAPIRHVDIDGVVVRATASNRITAFKFSGTYLDRDSCRVRNVVWDNFDYPGQTRFDGVLFDPIPMQGELAVTDGGTLLYRPGPRGAASPLRLRGRGSTTGEWVATQLPDKGIYLGNPGVKPNTRYEVYLWDNNGVRTLELSREKPLRDPASGYPVKSTDATRLYLGSVMGNAAGRFQSSASGWLNPTLVPGRDPGTYTRIWTDADGNLRMLAQADPRADTDGRVLR